MSESVKLDFTGDPAGLVAAIKSLQVENAKLKAGFEETSKAGTKGYAEQKAAIAELGRFASQWSEKIKTDGERNAETIQKLNAAYTMGKLSAEQHAKAIAMVGNEQKTLGETTVASAAQMVAGYMSVASIIQTVIAGLEHQIKLQDEVRDRAVAAGKASESLAFNAGGDMSADTFRQMTRDIQAASAGTLLSSADGMMSGAASAISSIAESDPKVRAAKTAAIARAVASVATDTNVVDMMSTTAQLGQVTGATTEAEYRRSLALASSGMSMANITDAKGLAFMARAGSVSLANSADGVDREKVMKDTIALWAATTVAMKDRTGEASATAVGDLSKSLREFTAANAIAGKTDMERLAAIRANPALAEEFKGKAGGGQAAALFQKLLDPNSEFAQAVAANQAGIKPDETALGNIAANMRATPQQQVAAENSRIDAMRSRFDADNITAAKSANARKLLRELRRQNGSVSSYPVIGNMHELVEYAEDGLGGDPVRRFEQELKQNIQDNRVRLAGKDPEAIRLQQVFDEMLAELKRLNEQSPPSPLPSREEGAN